MKRNPLIYTQCTNNKLQIQNQNQMVLMRNYEASEDRKMVIWVKV